VQHTCNFIIGNVNNILRGKNNCKSLNPVPLHPVTHFFVLFTLAHSKIIYLNTFILCTELKQSLENNLLQITIYGVETNYKFKIRSDFLPIKLYKVCKKNLKIKYKSEKNYLQKQKHQNLFSSSSVSLFVFDATAPIGPRPSSFTRFLDHTKRRTTVGWAPLDE
jgi:hypothetical protein